jgi:fatty acid desaturase
VFLFCEATDKLTRTKKNDPARSRNFELPTWLLIIAVYAGWFSTTWFAMSLPLWILLPMAAWFSGWYYSLQHEVIHGHPTSVRWINDLIGFAPLNLVIPYPIYRSSHIRHHTRENLTLPGIDPESFYFDAASWRKMPRLVRAIHVANNSLVGRLVIGPAMAAVLFWLSEIRLIRQGDYAHVTTWLVHFVLVAAVLYWVSAVCGMPIWLYVLAYAYPGFALTLMRSYIEHRDAADPDHRTAIVECQTLLGILYLHNNLHAAHHEVPSLPWYQLPAYYAERREQILEKNGGYLFRGYRDVIRHYLFAPIHFPVIRQSVPADQAV